jgi:hypothetical protein
LETQKHKDISQKQESMHQIKAESLKQDQNNLQKKAESKSDFKSTFMNEDKPQESSRASRFFDSMNFAKNEKGENKDLAKNKEVPKDTKTKDDKDK